MSTFLTEHNAWDIYARLQSSDQTRVTPQYWAMADPAERTESCHTQTIKLNTSVQIEHKNGIMTVAMQFLCTYVRHKGVITCTFWVCTE